MCSWVRACNLPCLRNIFSCLHSIPLGSELFEPCDISTLRVSADPRALKCPRGLVKHPQIMKSIAFPFTLATLTQFKFGQMDFLGGPAATHHSRTTYSRTTQSASPTELINPERLLKSNQISAIFEFSIVIRPSNLKRFCIFLRLRFRYFVQNFFIPSA